MERPAPYLSDLLDSTDELAELEAVIYYNVDLKAMREWRDAAKERIAKLKKSSHRRYVAHKNKYKNYEQITFSTKG